MKGHGDVDVESEASADATADVVGGAAETISFTVNVSERGRDHRRHREPTPWAGGP
jgi:hypothetical protein